jgi:deazaflavin-dependent oxidoreductase (nitroreductase family)
MPDNTINGIPRVDPRAPRTAWKRAMQSLVASKPGAAVHRMLLAPLDASVIRATGGHVDLAFGVFHIVVLTSIGARSGQRRETPLVYFTDGGDVILIASNYGGARHPSWYHNLLAHPECELHIGKRGGPFVAREATDADHDRLFTLAAALYPGYADYAQRTEGVRTIRTLRLTPTG